MNGDSGYEGAILQEEGAKMDNINLSPQDLKYPICYKDPETILIPHHIFSLLNKPQLRIPT